MLALSVNDGDADTASAEARVASTPGSATHRLSEAKPDDASLGTLHVTDTVVRNDGGKTIASDPNSSTANAVGSTMVDPQVQGVSSVIGVPSGAAAPSKETTAIDAGAGISERSELSPPAQVQRTPADIPSPPPAEDAARARRHAAPVPRNKERIGADSRKFVRGENRPRKEASDQVAGPTSASEIGAGGLSRPYGRTIFWGP